MRWLIRITMSLLLLALIGVGYQIVGMAQHRKQYPPLGKLIDVGKEIHQTPSLLQFSLASFI